MACSQDQHRDYRIKVRDGSATPIELVADVWSSLQVQRESWPLTWLTNGRGDVLPGVAPLKGDQTPARISLSGGRVTSLGAPSANVQTYTVTQTHAASAVYYVTVLLTPVGGVTPIPIHVQWSAGGSAGATDTAADDALTAAITAALAGGAVSVTVGSTGVVNVVLPAGASIEAVAEYPVGAGAAISAAVTNGTAPSASNTSFADIVRQTGNYTSLVSTTGSDDCMGSHKTFDVIVERISDGSTWTIEDAAFVAPPFDVEAGGILFEIAFEGARLKSTAAL